MLLQTNSYLVPRAKRAEHARLMQRFRVCFRRLGSDLEVFEQTGPDFDVSTSETPASRFIQMMRFRDRAHQQQVHEREQSDPVARRLIADFCRLVDLPQQQRHGTYAGGYYMAALAVDSTEGESDLEVEPRQDAALPASTEDAEARA